MANTTTITRRNVLQGAVAGSAALSAGCTPAPAATSHVGASSEIQTLVDQAREVRGEIRSLEKQYSEMLNHPDRPARPIVRLCDALAAHPAAISDHISYWNDEWYSPHELARHFERCMDRVRNAEMLHPEIKRTRLDLLQRGKDIAVNELQRQCDILKQWELDYGIADMDARLNINADSIWSLEERIVAYPCQSIEDVTVKAAYYLEMSAIDGLGELESAWERYNIDFQTFMRSLVPVTA